MSRRRWPIPAHIYNGPAGTVTWWRRGWWFVADFRPLHRPTVYGVCSLRCELAWDMPASHLEDVAMSYLRDPKSVPGSNGEVVKVGDEKWAKAWPAIFEYCTAVTYPEGAPRQTSSITLFCEDGQVKLCLTDRELDICLWATAGSFHDAFACLEARLRDPKADWRVSGRRRQVAKQKAGRGA